MTPLFFGSHSLSLSLFPRCTQGQRGPAISHRSTLSASFLFSGSRVPRRTDQPLGLRYSRVYHLANSVIGGFFGFKFDVNRVNDRAYGANDLAATDASSRNVVCRFARNLFFPRRKFFPSVRFPTVSSLFFFFFLFLFFYSGLFFLGNICITGNIYIKLESPFTGSLKR